CLFSLIFFFFLLLRRPLCSPLFPYTTLFRSMLISVELLIMLCILLFIPGSYAGPCFIGFAIGESLGAAALRIDFFQIFLNVGNRSEEHTSELQSQSNLVCRLLLEKKKKEKYK